MIPPVPNTPVGGRSVKKPHSFRLIEGLVMGVFVWFATAVILGRIIAAVGDADPKTPPMRIGGVTFGFGLTFPSSRGNLPIGFSLHWWNLPGMLIGAALAVWILLSAIRAHERKV
jgi:hypothetical protein